MNPIENGEKKPTVENPVGNSYREAPFYRAFSQTFQAYQECLKRGNAEWELKHKDTLKGMIDSLPSGSGIDSSTQFDWDKSTPDKLVFYADYHHMNEGGYYDGWTCHTVTVRPSLAFGIALSISGKNRNDIKGYLHDVYHTVLTEQIKY